MKISEMMVGDWVEHVCIMSTVSSISNSNRKFNVRDRLGVHLAFSTTVKPIPISKKILENNGFVLKNKEEIDSNLIYLVKKDSYIEYIPHNNMFFIFGKNRNFNGILEYVHELQHALRLCEIDKKIIIQQ